MTSHYQKIQEKKMKRIKLKDYKKVYRQYMLDDLDVIEFIDKRNDYGNKEREKDFFIQNGGRKTEELEYVHNNIRFLLYEIKSKEGYDISVRRKNDLSKSTCLHIIINAELRLAYIQNISYYPDCVSTGLEKPGGGGKLLKMCIHFLKDTKNKYNVKRIQLKDNSFFVCKSNNKRINFALMNTLLHGDTWYGKYGFRPYDFASDMEDKELTEIYNNNKKIATTTKTQDTNLYNYLSQMLREKEPNNEKK